MREDREATQRFKIECEKYGIAPIITENEVTTGEDDSPFYGGSVPMM